MYIHILAANLVKHSFEFYVIDYNFIKFFNRIP